MRKRIKNGILLLLALALAASAGGCARRARPARTPKGETLFRLGFPGAPETLNPYAADSAEAAAALALLYDTLFVPDPEGGEPLGGLCQELTVTDGAAEGGKLWRLTLRSDVYWHDGQPLTARDVEFSLQSQRDFSTLYAYPHCELIDVTGIAVEDDTHLAFIVWGDRDFVTECLTYVPILPRHIWNGVEGMDYDAAGIPRDAARARTALYEVSADKSVMVGSGPYVWEGYENGVCTLRANTGYRDGVPRAGVLELRYGCADPGAMLARGELDGCWNMSYADYETLAWAGEQSLAAGGAGELYMLSFNLPGDTQRLGARALQNQTLRQALERCVDRRAILAEAFGGGVPVRGLLVPESPWSYESELPDQRSFDLDAAAAALAAAGYADADADGYRETPGGEKLSLTLLYSDAIPAWGRSAERLRRDFAGAGVTLELRALPPEELLAAAAAGDYDLLLSGWPGFQDPWFALNLFYWNGGDNAFSAENGSGSYPGWNLCGFEDPGYDALFEQLYTARGEARQALARQLGLRLYDAAAAVPIGFSARFQGCSAAWQGLRPGSTGLYFDVAALRAQFLRMSAQGKK